MSDTETSDVPAVLGTLQRIATGQEQSNSIQRDLSQATRENTLAVQELTIMVERQRGEVNTRFQSVEDRVGIVETRQHEYDEELKETSKRRWAVVMAGLGAVAAWLGSHWPFHITPPPHGR